MNSINDSVEKIDGTRTKVVSWLKDYLKGSFLMGLILFIIVFFTLWMILSLDYLVLIPIELLVQGQSAVIILLGYTLIVTILAISSIPSIIVIGYVNRSIVGRDTKVTLPRNHKWLVLQGLIIYVVTMMLFIPYFEFLASVQSSLRPWSETFPGTMGDGFIVLILAALLNAFSLTLGLFGYLIAFKLPLFRNSYQDEIESSGERY